MYLGENDFECPYCYNKLEEEYDSEGKMFRYSEECGKSFKVEEERYG